MPTRLIGLVLALVLVLAPFAAETQPGGKVYRVALILTTAPVAEMQGPSPAIPGVRGLLEGLRQLGYEEGRNLVLERRSAEGKFERYPEIAAELVRLRTDVIVSVGNLMTQRVQEVARATPIVMGTSVSPVEVGLVRSLARPGGNVTGLTIDTGPEIVGKRLEFLKQAVPRASQVAFIGLKSEWEHPNGEHLRQSAPSFGVTLLHAEPKPNDYREAFSLIGRERPDALVVGDHPAHVLHQRVLVDFAARSQLPAIYGFREFVAGGGLMSYGASIPDLFRRAAVYVDKILKGAKPADLPIEQPTTFELVVNLKTAKALGLTIPQSILVRADEILQ